MDFPLCRTCNTKHRLGAMFCPSLRSDDGDDKKPSYSKKNNGPKRVERLQEVTSPATVEDTEVSASGRSAGTGSAGVAGSNPARSTINSKREFRKPLAKDAHKTLTATKPWESEGVSRASWYRRQKEYRG